ncbi:hypothetical protein Tco_1167826 [Tanacetum coccineum]
MSTSKAPAMTQAAIRKLVVDSVTTALEAQASNIVNTDNTTRLKDAPVARQLFSRSKCVEENKVTFATGTLTDDALSCIVSETEVRKMKMNFTIDGEGNDLKTYLRRFQELAVLCPNMVPNTEKLMVVFIGGLPRSIEGNVTALKLKYRGAFFTISKG